LIDETIGHYEGLQSQTSDEQLRKAVAELITELEAKKSALHPKSPI
jgi:hypothetical protein